MKILLTAHQFFPDFRAGTEVLTLSVAKELMSRGHDVHVFTGYPSREDLHDSDRFDQYMYEGIHVYRFHHAYSPMAGQTSLIEIGYDNKLAANFFDQILESFKPDLIHFFHLNRLGTGLIEKAVIANIPAFLTPTDFWFICPTGQLVLDNGELCSGPSSNAGNCVKHIGHSTNKGLVGGVIKSFPTVLVDFIVRLTQAEVLPPYPQRIEVKAIGSRLPTNVIRLNKLKKIISPNSFMTEKLRQHGVLPSIIVQLAYGIDIPKSAARKPRQSPQQPLRIGFIGTLAKHKGCHLLIEAFKALPPELALLKIYGSLEDFPEYSSHLKVLAENRVDISFCGTFHNSKIAEVLADLDVLVVPSLWYENTPLVIYSAQAARCPVIASNFPSISEVVINQVNGLLFEAGNVEELTIQLLRLIDEPNLTAKLNMGSFLTKSTVTYVDELLNLWELNK